MKIVNKELLEGQLQLRKFAGILSEGPGTKAFNKLQGGEEIPRAIEKTPGMVANQKKFYVDFDAVNKAFADNDFEHSPEIDRKAKSFVKKYNKQLFTVAWNGGNSFSTGYVGKVLPKEAEEWLARELPGIVMKLSGEEISVESAKAKSFDDLLANPDSPLEGIAGALSGFEVKVKIAK